MDVELRSFSGRTAVGLELLRPVAQRNRGVSEILSPAGRRLEDVRLKMSLESSSLLVGGGDNVSCVGRKTFSGLLAGR